jgi:hypothetical protein
MSVGAVNDEGLPLDMRVKMRLFRVCGLAARQRVSLSLHGFDDEKPSGHYLGLFEMSN